MKGFVYTPSLLVNIERIISAERLSRYLAATSGDMHAALKLYEYNVAVSEALFGLLHSLEIAVRNSIHSVLSADFGIADWYQNGLTHPPTGQPLPFTNPMLRTIATARGRVESHASTGKLIAEIAFGFWPNLVSSTFHDCWIASLHKAFPHLSVSRSIVHWRLDVIHRLRNRIAHHEPILTSQGRVFTGHPNQPYLDLPSILECMHWVCADAAIWLEETSRYKQAQTWLVEVSKSGLSL